MISILDFTMDKITSNAMLIKFGPYILFAVGLVLLIYGGNWFVDGASGIAKKFHVPEILIGATVVSIGTTLPEVMVSSMGAFDGNGSIAYGNAIGSIICNTALIAAITIAIKPAKAERKTMILPVCFFFAAAALYSYTAYVTKDFSRVFGVILLVLFLIYMLLVVRQVMKKNDGKELPKDEPAPSISDEDSAAKESGVAKMLILLVLGAAMIAIGAKLLNENAVVIAKNFGVPDTVIALTIVALGTSLPELVTAITSLVKGHGSLSLGNIIGANLFNLVLVSGMAITIRPFPLPVGTTVGGMNASLVIDIPVMLFVMIVMTIPTLIRGKLSRWQGILLLLTYASYITTQILLTLNVF